MSQLPVELRRLCIEALLNHCDRDDTAARNLLLKPLRLVNRDLETVTSAYLFHTVYLRQNDTSAKQFVDFSESRNASVVRHIMIDTLDTDAIASKQRQTDVNRTFLFALSRLHLFDNIDHATLKFSQVCANGNETAHDEQPPPHTVQTEYFRTTILSTFFTSLESARSLNFLTIENLQDLHDPKVFDNQDFSIVRSRLTGLHLSITSEFKGDMDRYSYHSDAHQKGWAQSLPNIWWKPLSSQLTHLSISIGSSRYFWGTYPLVRLPVFPKLVTLALSDMTIAHQWQIDWFIAHANTIQELTLIYCQIVTILKYTTSSVATDFPACEEPWIHKYDDKLVFNKMRWGYVFDRFKMELPHLIKFEFGHGEDWSEAWDARYTEFCEADDDWLGVDRQTSDLAEEHGCVADFCCHDEGLSEDDDWAQHQLMEAIKERRIVARG